MKMLIVGGGTGGPTAPLFAVAEKVKKRFQKTKKKIFRKQKKKKKKKK